MREKQERKHAHGVKNAGSWELVTDTIDDMCGTHTVVEVQLLDALDGVPLLAHGVDLVTCAVRGARVGH